METDQLKNVIEALLLAAGRPLSVEQLLAMFAEYEKPERSELQDAISALQADYESRGIELLQVGSGYRIQVRDTMQPWIAHLWEEKPSRYSRALLETLALIAYRQPVTRGEIEEVRGVSVSTTIIKTLLEREWVHVVGHREVPGRPAMYGTTKKFLDYFSLKNLNELPSLAELRDLNEIGRELELDLSEIPGLELASANDEAAEQHEASADTATTDEVVSHPDITESDSVAIIH
jgi:segregation and condensation protein B